MKDLAPTASSVAPAGSAQSSADPAGAEQARAVRSVVRRLLRRGLLIGILGVVAAVAFVLVFRAHDSRAEREARLGEVVDAEVQEYRPGPPKEVKVQYTIVEELILTSVELDPLAPMYEEGQIIKVVVRDLETPESATVVGEQKTSRLTSLPASLLFVGSVVLIGYAAFEVQTAVRVLRHLRRGVWQTWAWRGVVDGPGRGHVNVVGYLTSTDRATAHLMANARGCWREGLDLLDGRTVVHVHGTPAGHVVVRHPASLKPVILRSPKNERSRRKAIELLDRSAHEQSLT